MSGQDDSVVKIVSTLGVKYDPSGVKKMEADIERISKLVKDAAKEINSSLMRPLDGSAAKNLVDQFGKPLKTAAEQATAAAQAMKSGHMHAAMSIKELLPTLQAQTAQVQAQLKSRKMGNTELMEQAKLIRSQVQALQDQFDLVGKLSTQEEKRARALREEAAILKANAQTVMADAKKPVTFADQVSSQFDRRLSWFASGAAIVGGYNEMRQGVEVVKDMETAMTSLNRVMNDTSYISSDMRKKLSELGTEFGFQFDVVSQIATTWAQAGYSMQDTLAATRATLLGLNTAEMDVKSGTESLIGIMSQWGMKASDLTGIIDTLNLAADRYPVTTGDLIDGLLRSGAAARNAGIDFQHVIGLLVAMREASGRTGKEVGTSLNSILSFATRKESLDTFQKSGIAVFADAATGKLRPMIDVLNDVATNWTRLSDDAKDAMAAQAEAAGLYSQEMADALGKQEQWSDLQKRDVTSAAAAAYRRNYLLSLLSNFGRVQETVNTLQNAEGYSLKENAKAMEAYGKKVEQVKASLQDALFSLAEESGLLGGLKGLADGLRSGAEWWNSLDVATRQAMLAIVAVNGVLLALNATTKNFAGVSLAGAVTQLISYVRTVGIATAASRALSAAMSTMLGPAGLAVMGISAVAGAWAYASAKAAEAEEAMRNAGAQAEQIEKLRSRYLELAENTSRTKQEETELHDVSKQLVDLMPTLASGFDSAGNAILNMGDVAAQTAKKIADLNAQSQLFLEGKAASGKLELPGLQATLKDARKQYDAVLKALKEGPDAVKALNLPADATVLYQGPFMDVMKNAQIKLSEYQAIITDTQKQINDIEAAISAVSPPRVLSDNEQALAEKLATKHWKPAPKSNPTNTTTLTTSGVKALADSVTSEFAALELAGKATERYIGILSNRLDYEGREGATAEELAQADKDRAELLSTLSERQEKLAQQAVAARQAVVSLRAAQGALNLSTEEGKSAYEELGREINSLIEQAGTFENPVGALSEQWWKLQKQKVELGRQDNAITTETLRNLKDLKESYQKGLTPLDAYVKALGRLENQAGLSADALKQLNEEQGAGLLAQWTRDLEAEITKGDKALKAFGNDIDNIFDKVSKASKKTDLATMMNTLRGSLSSLNGSYALPTNTIDAATATTKGLIGDVLNGKFAPNADALMKMDRTEFLAAVTQGKDDLLSAAQSVNSLLVSIGNERDAVIRSIDAQIKPINDVLKQFDVLDKTDAAKELKDAMTNSLNKLYGKTDKLPGLPTADQLKTLVGSIKVSDLGALAPDKFAATMKEDMNNLRGLATTTKTYLEGVTKGYTAQIDAIDAQLRTIDAGLEERLGKLQAQLDELDQQDKTDQRAKEKADLDARRKEINDELAWRLQNESKYAFEIAALNKQKADLDKEAADKQREWDRADKRESIQGEMDAERKKADERKAALEEQKRILQEQQQMWQEALNDVLAYVNGEIAGLKELGQERVNNLETEKQQETEKYNNLLTALSNVRQYVTDEIAEWQRLADERKAIEEKAWSDDKDSIKSIINNGTLGVMALMVANGEASGQAYVDSIIKGINEKRAELQGALNSLTSATAAYQNAQTDPIAQVMALHKAGKDDEAAALLSQKFGMSLPQAKKNLAGMPKFANEAYVRARPGGVIANIAEAGVDEVVMRIDRLQPKFNAAMLNAIRTLSSGASFIGSSARDIASAVREGLSDMKFYGVVDVTLPSGEVKRQIIEVFAQSGIGQAVRAM